MPNFAALRSAVFPLSTKNLRGGGYPPPVGARVKNQKETALLYIKTHLHGIAVFLFVKHHITFRIVVKVCNQNKPRLV